MIFHIVNTFYDCMQPFGFKRDVTLYCLFGLSIEVIVIPLLYFWEHD